MTAILNGVTITDDKIDNAAVDGLTGVSNSLAYKVEEIERHLHSTSRWLETAAVPSGETHIADRIGAGSGSFQIDAGNDDWGAWVQILGSDDTPINSGNSYFDPHQVIVSATERNALYAIQIGRGDSGAAVLAAGTYTEFIFNATVVKDSAIIMMQTGRAPAGDKLWARCICPGQNTATFNFYFGLHEYEG